MSKSRQRAEEIWFSAESAYNILLVDQSTLIVGAKRCFCHPCKKSTMMLKKGKVAWVAQQMAEYNDIQYMRKIFFFRWQWHTVINCWRTSLIFVFFLWKNTTMPEKAKLSERWANAQTTTREGGCEKCNFSAASASPPPIPSPSSTSRLSRSRRETSSSMRRRTRKLT